MKVLYNVTVKIETSIHLEWLDWMIKIHIPDVMTTGCFDSYKMTRILGDEDEQGHSYAIQYLSPDMESFMRYNTLFAKKLQEEHAHRYSNKYVAFRTLMEVISES